MLAAVAVYWPAFDGEFVWDDQNVWLNELPHFQSAWDVLRPPGGSSTWTYAYYRPVVVTSYLLDIGLGGPTSPRVPHATNVLCHVLTTWCVWWLLRRVLQKQTGASGGALVGALLFAVHPIHTESVSWIAGRSDLLATLFLVPAVGTALRGFDQQSKPLLMLSPLLFFLAVNAKEIGISGLVLVPLTLVLVRPDSYRQSADDRPRPRYFYARQWGVLGTGYLIAGGAWLWLRYWALVQSGVSQGFSPLEMAAGMLRAAGFYASRLLVPWPQSSLVSWDMAPSTGASVLIAGIGVCIGLVGFQQWRRHGDGTLLLGTLWFWVAILIPLWSAVGPISKTPLAERHLYLPSVGAAIVIGWTFCAVAAGGGRRITRAVAGLLLVVFSLSTIQRGFIWQQDLLLWSDTVQKVPDRGMAWLNLGLSQFRAGNSEGALISLKRVLNTKEEPQIRSRAATLMGSILLQKNQPDSAEAYLRRAITAWPASSEAYFWLARVYIHRVLLSATPSDHDTNARLALRFLTRALERNPGYHVARLQLAKCSTDYADSLEKMGDGTQALFYYAEARHLLNTLQNLLPPPVRTASLAILRRETGIDGEALHTQLDKSPGSASFSPPAENTSSP